MPHVFGRIAAPEHPLSQKLAVYDGTAAFDGLIAETWRYDWRVSPGREQVAVGHLCGPGSDSELRRSYRQYHGACICRGNPCEYCHSSNHGNRVPGISRHTRLCRVVCLNEAIFRQAALESLPEVRAARDWGAWLNQRLGEEHTQRGAVGQRQFVSRLFAAWNNWRGRDKRPVWASFWADVEPLAAQPDWADGLRDAFGLGTIGADQWLVLLSYELKDVGECYRPTCLEADWQPWHTLSPPGQPYGYAMDLSPEGGRCCPEVVHAPISLEMAHWTGQIDRTTRGLGEYDLHALRGRQYRVLQERFARAGADWLPALGP